MTQELTFETDDLNSFELMLKSAVRVLFPKSKGQYINLHIKKEHPGFWEDGKYDNYENGPSILDKGSDKYALLEHKQTYGGAFFVKEKQTFGNKDEAADASNSCKKEPKPKRLWIATLSDYASDFSPEDTSCANHKSLVEKSMKLMRKFPRQRVFDEIGSGRHHGFNSFDGSIGIAYRMEYAPMGGWNLLYLSATHAYYGK